MSETRSLKALADAVLRRDTSGDDERDKSSHEGDALAREVIAALAEADTRIPPAVAAETAATIAATLRDAGWIVVYSAVINCEVIFTRDAGVVIPDEYASLPRFDLGELAVLAAERPSPDRLRAIVDAKREMPGTRVVRDTGERLTPARELLPSTDPKTDE